jgi:DNA-binding SARP family transcriptional activator
MHYYENSGRKRYLVNSIGAQRKLEMRLLGGLKVVVDGKPIAGGVPRKAKSLLAFLAVEVGRPHPRDILAEMLWPERPQGVARNNLRQALLILRQSVGDKDLIQPFLLPTTDTIQFNIKSPSYLDTREFEQLIEVPLNHEHLLLQACATCQNRFQRAVNCYQGDFLTDVPSPDAPDFDSWVVMRREKYRRDQAMALRVMNSMHVYRNEHQEGSLLARKLVELEPWDEANHRILMRSLALAGMRSAAMKQYQTCTQMLEEEFHAGPSSETTELYNAIRDERVPEVRELSDSQLALNPPARSEPQGALKTKPWYRSLSGWQWGTALAVIGAGVLILSGALFNRDSDLSSSRGNAMLADGPDSELVDGADADSETLLEFGDIALSDDETVSVYIPTDDEVLAQGHNGLLPSEACGISERLLYIEDFQDGEAPGWLEIEFHSRGWALIPHPDQEANLVMVNPVDIASPPEGNVIAMLRGFTLGDAVARIRVMPTGTSIFSFTWHFLDRRYETDDGLVEWSSYQLWFEPPGSRVIRSQEPLSDVILREVNRTLESGAWHIIEIGTFNGQLDVWIDGVRFFTYVDPNPLPPGALTMSVVQVPGDQSQVYFDDISICELTAPLTSISAP